MAATGAVAAARAWAAPAFAGCGGAPPGTIVDFSGSFGPPIPGGKVGTLPVAGVPGLSVDGRLDGDINIVFDRLRAAASWSSLGCSGSPSLASARGGAAERPAAVGIGAGRAAACGGTVLLPGGRGGGALRGGAPGGAGRCPGAGGALPEPFSSSISRAYCLRIHVARSLRL
ncbi:hypothetical protein [Nannocystis pusilla]|uniref:hypothetical protein n=1 Tax=Nannocystis pusilla TaxID=889268 RepID=UPI003DA3E11B